MMPYEKLVAWQAAHRLVLVIYRLTERLPRSELYGLTSQLRRASVSIATNIAEGVAKRGTTGEFRRYLDIAIGSLSEVSYLVRLAVDLGYVTMDERREAEELRERTSRLTWGLYRATRRRTSRSSTATAFPSDRPTVRPSD